MFRLVYASFSLVFILLISIYLPSCRGESLEKNQEKYLSENWTISNDSLEIKAKIPGTVQYNLMEQNIIPDPFFGTNESSSRWVESEIWNYKTHFKVGDLDANYNLTFHGLDTYGKIYLNDILLDSPNNAFRTWDYSINSFLKKGKNTIRIQFFPIQNIMDSLYSKLSYQLPYDSRVMVRKAPYQFGWDWGPTILPVGITKPVVLKKWENIKLNDVQYHQIELNDKHAKLEAKLEIEASSENTKTVIIRLGNKALAKKKINLHEGANTIHLDFKIVNPELWWPNGYGEAYLYEFICEIQDKNKCIESDTTAIGLRKIELITETDKIGESFYFKINDKSIFIKGANYIPSDVFIERTTKEQYEKLIHDAVLSNFNMLRVWGGGIYERDIFYDLCDQKGILVWQDFMFACALYPGDSAYMENVQKEVSDNILRLRKHPCLALWCGNNEINEAWHHWGIQNQFSYSSEDSIKVWSDYLHLFDSLIPKTISYLDPERQYWQSSPKYGWGNPESMKSGDSHYWGVWWGEEPFEKYIEKTGRFMSEFGFQSHPGLNSIKKFIPENERFIGSKSMQVHQKHPRGDELIDLYMKRDFPVPDNFNDYIYVSNLVQAYGMGMGIESHRRAKPTCMGTLYWQFNDCWPVTSWSGIDYFGNWKALQYEVKRLYEPILISPVIEENNLKLFVISDKLQNISGELKIEIKSFDNVLYSHNLLELKIPGNSSNMVFQEELPLDIDFSEHYIKIEFVSKANILAEKFFFIEKPKDLKLNKVIPEFILTKQTDAYALELLSKYFIKDLYIEIAGKEYFLSDNYFNLEPNAKKVIYVYTEEEITEADIKFNSLNQLLDE